MTTGRIRVFPSGAVVASRIDEKTGQLALVEFNGASKYRTTFVDGARWQDTELVVRAGARAAFWTRTMRSDPRGEFPLDFEASGVRGAQIVGRSIFGVAGLASLNTTTVNDDGTRTAHEHTKDVTGVHDVVSTYDASGKLVSQTTRDTNSSTGVTDIHQQNADGTRTDGSSSTTQGARGSTRPARRPPTQMGTSSAHQSRR